MAAKNGSIRTILAVVVVLLALCVIGVYLFAFMGKTMGQRKILVERAPIFTEFHDHRVDRWT